MIAHEEFSRWQQEIDLMSIVLFDLDHLENINEVTYSQLLEKYLENHPETIFPASIYGRISDIRS